jgi:hypothetical protein
LGAFLDIEGASDNTTFEFMCKAAEEHGVEQGVVRWIHTVFRSWQIVTAQMGCRLRVSVAGVGFCPHYCGAWWWMGSLQGSIKRVCTHKAMLMTGLVDNGEILKHTLRVHAKSSEHTTKLVQGQGAICQS